MVMDGETIKHGANQLCTECDTLAVLGVYQSNAGYYIGTYCKCGPYSRESGYYKNKTDAEQDLVDDNYDRQ